mmetsp:Transcript_32642/g.77296  ORF Transcript_32642/g.77296 Transcript_32642/m.77296 type:complete len:269 (+) Transcript_32642:372-1178(+)
MKRSSCSVRSCADWRVSHAISFPICCSSRSATHTLASRARSVRRMPEKDLAGTERRAPTAVGHPGIEGRLGVRSGPAYANGCSLLELAPIPGALPFSENPESGTVHGDSGPRGTTVACESNGAPARGTAVACESGGACGNLGTTDAPAPALPALPEAGLSQPPEADLSATPEAGPSGDPEAGLSHAPEAGPSISPEVGTSHPEADPSAPETGPSGPAAGLCHPEAGPSCSPEASASRSEAGPSGDGPAVGPSCSPEAGPSRGPEAGPL